MSLEAARHAVPFFREVPLNHLQGVGAQRGQDDSACAAAAIYKLPIVRGGRVLFAVIEWHPSVAAAAGCSTVFCLWVRSCRTSQLPRLT